MTDQRPGGGLRAGHWLLIGVVALLLAGGAFIVLRRGDPPDPVGQQPSSPAVSPAPGQAVMRPDCTPEITERWVGPLGAGTHFGFVYASRCDLVVRKLRFKVVALDATGAPIREVPEKTAFGGVLLPGTELAAADAFTDVDDKRPVAAIEVTLLGAESFPAADFSGWGKAQVTDLKASGPPGGGSIEITGSVSAEPSTASLCVGNYVLVLRDKTGKLVYAQQGESRPRRPVFTLMPVAGADLAKSTVYALQVPFTEPPGPGRPCGAS